MKRIFNLSFNSYPKLNIQLIYRKGKLSEIKKLDNAPSNIHDWIAQIAPREQEQIGACRLYFKNKVEYNEVIKDTKFSLHRSLTGAWMTFYKKKHGIEPKHGAIEGKAITGIKSYLVKLTNTEQEALAVWENILERWVELDQFTQSKCELVYINSKLNLIVTQLKPSSDVEETRGL